MAARKRKQSPTKRAPERDASAIRESGEPGGGAGRRDEVGRSGVYPYSAPDRPHGTAEIRTPGQWGHGDAPVNDELGQGGSELYMREGQLLGGTTAGPSGAPTIDIHHDSRLPDPTHEIGNPAGKHGKQGDSGGEQKGDRDRR